MNWHGGGGWSAHTGAVDGKPVIRVCLEGEVVHVAPNVGEDGDRMTTDEVCALMVSLERTRVDG